MFRLSADISEQAGRGEAAPRPYITGVSFASLLTILLLCAVLPYLNTLGNGFIYDDNNEILNNPYLRSFGHLREILSTNTLAHLGARGVTNYYRPVSVVGFLLCYQAFGPLAYGFHLANLLLNAAVVCVLFALTDRMFRNRTLAFVTAALFALHPVHTEAVAWVSAVTDLDVGFFFLLTFWFYLGVACPGRILKMSNDNGGRVQHPEGAARPDWARVGTTASFVLALLSKEQAAVIPLLATLYEHLYREDRSETSWQEKFGRYYALWLVLLAYVLFRMRFFGGFTAVLLTKVTWYEAFLSAFVLQAAYLWKFLSPIHLCAYYSFHQSVSPLDVRVLAGLGAFLFCLALFVLLWRRARPASFGLLWYFATIAPVLNARWIGPNVFAERYLYLPSVGLCWVAAWGGLRIGDWVSRRRRAMRNAAAGALGCLVLLAVTRIVTRNRDWQNEVNYYRATLAREPEALGLWINLGSVYWNSGNPREAEAQWRRAEALDPNNAMVLNNLGLVFAGKKDYRKAVECFERSMRQRPIYTDAHLNLGRVLAEQGMEGPAELQLRAAVALAPLSIQARNGLGRFYFDNGRFPEAEEQFMRSVASEPNSLAYDSLGDIYARRGRPEQSERAFKQAMALDDFDSRAHFGLAALYVTAGRNAEAVREYQAGLRTDPANPQALAALRQLRSHDSR
jgi:tetratricopeptide (TPR) repeat protein